MSAVLGLDLSLTSTGVAVVRADGTAHVDRVRSKGSKDDTVKDTVQRISDIVSWIEFKAYGLALGEEFSLAVIESPSFSSHDGKQHERGGLWWAVAAHVLTMAPRVVVAPPSTLKKYVAGVGNADKDKVLAAMVRRFPRLDLTNDTADALGLACMGVRLLGRPSIDGDLPDRNLAALDALARD